MKLTLILGLTVAVGTTLLSNMTAIAADNTYPSTQNSSGTGTGNSSGSGTGTRSEQNSSGTGTGNYGGTGTGNSSSGSGTGTRSEQNSNQMNHSTTDNVSPRGNHDGSLLTPTNQSLNDTDVEITRRIRDTLTSDSSLSTSAQNIKIITTNGVITLRGAVKSKAEHRKVVAAAKKFMGTNSVNDRLTINTR